MKLEAELRTGLASAARKLPQIALTLLGLTMITFFIGRVMPIDPAAIVAGEKSSPETYAQIRTVMGLDRPLYVQYLSYLTRVVTGDFGTSFRTAQPVLSDLARVFPATVELTIASMLIATLAGVPCGVWAASHRNGWQDQLSRLILLFGYSTPTFWFGLVALLLVYAKLGWVGGPGQLDPAFMDLVPRRTGLIIVDSLIAGDLEVFNNAVQHLVLPAFVLGFHTMAYIARMTRTFMLAQLGQEYVLAARAKGASRHAVIWRHAFRNVRVQLVTIVALTLANLLEGAIVTEAVFAWPGLGSYLRISLFAADLDAVLGATLLIGIIYIGLNLLTDAVYHLLQPQVRA